MELNKLFDERKLRKIAPDLEKSKSSMSISGKVSLELLNSFINHQNQRKDILYGLDYEVDKNDAEASIADAYDFLLAIRGLL